MTPIRALEQVEYRLVSNCGCDQAVDAQVEYRLAENGDLRWIGSGLGELGLVAGEVVDPDVARALMDGRDPEGKQLVKRKRVLDPRGKVVARVLVDALTEAAAQSGVELGELLGSEQLAARVARAERGLLRDGEAHLIPVADAERLAAAAGLDAEVLYGAEVLAEARRWQHHHVDVGLRGVDVVLDLPKSISAAYAVASPELAAAIEAAWMESVNDAVAALEAWTAYGMAGHHGDGQRAARIETSGFLGWTTLHRSARPVDASPGDPHLHVHVNLAHLARCSDGKWRTIAAGAEDLHRHAHLVNEIAEGRLRALLAERHGARFERSDRTGAWELAGVDAGLREAFSRRYQQVLDLAGEDASRDEQKAAARISAEVKNEDAGAREDWHSRAVQVLGDAQAVTEMVATALPGPDGPTPAALAGGGPQAPTPEQITRQIWDAETGLTAHRKTVQHTHVMAAVAQALPELESVEQLVALTDDVLAVDGHAVRLADSNRAHHSNRQRYTHSAVVEAERGVIEAATAGLDAGLAQLTEPAAELALSTSEAAQSFEFSAEQRAVLARLLTAGHAVDAVIGVAGAGKTTLMSAARTGWEAAGLRVAGASTAAVAAANLAAEAGVSSRTIAAWTRDVAGGRGLADVDVLVIDEAAMVDDRALVVLLDHAAETRTKVVGIGDPLQLRAVGVGGAFNRVHQLVDGLTLTENRRQADVVERAALQTWRDGGRTSALAQLAGHGRIHAEETATDALTGMLGAWNDARGAWDGDPHGQLASLLLLAARRADVDTLNAGARAVRSAAGELVPGRTYALAGGGRIELSVGDLVHVRRNDYRSRRDRSQPDVLNGFRGVAVDVDERQGVLVEWRRSGADGARVERAWMSPADVAEGRLTLGYAMTVAAAQGLTAEVTVAYGHGADAHTLYPALSRARAESHLWLPLRELEDDADRARLGAPRSDQERLDRAVAAYGRALERDSGDTMVVDELDDERQAHTAPARRQPPARTELAASPPPSRTETTAEREDLENAPEPEVPHWRQRPYGRVPTPHLEQRAEAALARAERAEQRAEDATEAAAGIEASFRAATTPGQARAAEAADVLNEAAQHARTAAQHVVREREAREAARQAQDALAAVQRAASQSRLTLRLAGTSRREQRELADACSERHHAFRRTAEQAARDAEVSRRLAWQTVRESRYAEALGAAGPPPRDAGSLQQRLQEMHGRATGMAARIDRHHISRARQLRADARAARTDAARQRETAAGLRAERRLREDLTPVQRLAETQQRTQHLQQQRQREEQRRREAYAHEQEFHRRAPSGPDIGGPGIGL